MWKYSEQAAAALLADMTRAGHQLIIDMMP
jgi:hypothetical protein